MPESRHMPPLTIPSISKTVFRLLLGLLLSFPAFAQEDWVQMPSPDGAGRHHPITVANEAYAYVLAGQDGATGQNLSDVHRYDAVANAWTTLEPFPGGGRGYGYGVCEGDDAYIGFGSNNFGFPTDFWHLDMSTGQWTALASFPGDGRNHPAMVYAAGHVVVGLGSNDDGNLGDWWAYNVETDAWEERTPFVWGDRHHPFYFGIDDVAYVGFGHGNSVNDNLTIYRDFYAYDVVADAWTVLDDFPGEARVAGTQFAANGKGYVLSGDGDNHGPLDDGEFWEYDPATDGWTELPPHPGGARWAPGSFVQGCYAYLTGGMEGAAVPFPIYHHDLWRVSLVSDCGCTDEDAVNFDDDATTDDGSCCYVAGCMDVTAVNYNEEACQPDGSCVAPILGCTNPESSNFDAEANTEIAVGGPITTGELGAGSFHYNDNWDMEFSVFEPTRLTSVDVFAQGPFTIDVYVKNALGVALTQSAFSLATGWNTLNLDVDLPSGTDFVIGIEGENQGLYRNNAVPAGAFPMPVADRIGITGNTTDSPLEYFYYFYKWVVESPCSETVATEEVSQRVALYPNPSRGGLLWVDGLEDGTVVEVFSLGGTCLWRDVAQKGEPMDVNALPSGMHFVRANGKVLGRVVLIH